MKKHAKNIKDIFADIPRLNEAILRYKVFGELNMLEVKKALKPDIGLMSEPSYACIKCILTAYEDADFNKSCSDIADCRTYDYVLHQYCGEIFNSKNKERSTKYSIYFKDPTK